MRVTRRTHQPVEGQWPPNIPNAMRCGRFVWPDRVRDYVADAIVHAAWLVLPISALAYALMRPDLSVSLVIYAGCLLAVVIASTANNMAPLGRARAWLSRIDRAVIYPFIAATVGAVLTAEGLTTYRAAVLAAVWVAAGVGVVLKLGFPRRFHRLGIALYLGLGWVAVLGLAGVAATLGWAGLALLALGGLLYTVGVPIYLNDDMPYRAAIWHMMCLAAGVCHLGAILIARA